MTNQLRSVHALAAGHACWSFSTASVEVEDNGTDRLVIRSNASGEAIFLSIAAPTRTMTQCLGPYGLVTQR